MGLGGLDRNRALDRQSKASERNPRIGTTMYRAAPLVLLLLTSAISAGAVTEELLRCLRIEDIKSRVDCYDNIARGLPRTVTPDDPPSSNSFGLEAAKARREEPEVIESHIPGQVDGWEAGAKIRLANGQVWQVSDGSRGVYYARDPKVRIRRGALGTFYLEFEGLNRSPQVKRLS